jgi:hypothetical protein
MYAERPSEALVSYHSTRRRHNPQDRDLDLRHEEPQISLQWSSLQFLSDLQTKQLRCYFCDFLSISLKWVMFLAAFVTELRQYMTSRMIVNRLMETHLPVAISFTPLLLGSPEALPCLSDRPLFVFPYGKGTTRNSLVQVSSERHYTLEWSTHLATKCSIHTQTFACTFWFRLEESKTWFTRCVLPHFWFNFTTGHLSYWLGFGLFLCFVQQRNIEFNGSWNWCSALMKLYLERVTLEVTDT